MKDAYGKAHVIDLDRIDDGPKVAARPSALGLERIRDRRIRNHPYEPAGKDKSSQQEVPPLPAPELPLPEPCRDCTDQGAPSPVVAFARSTEEISEPRLQSVQDRSSAGSHDEPQTNSSAKSLSGDSESEVEHDMAELAEVVDKVFYAATIGDDDAGEYTLWSV